VRGGGKLRVWKSGNLKEPRKQAKVFGRVPENCQELRALKPKALEL
jgi:hypothetical protein